VICQFCGYEFPDACGKYGCPNCLGEGLEDDEEMNPLTRDSLLAVAIVIGLAAALLPRCAEAAPVDTGEEQFAVAGERMGVLWAASAGEGGGAFGLYDLSDHSIRLELFAAGDGVSLGGTSVPWMTRWPARIFGWYMQEGDTIWYSEAHLNGDEDRFKAFETEEGGLLGPFDRVVFFQGDHYAMAAGCVHCWPLPSPRPVPLPGAAGLMGLAVLSVVGLVSIKRRIAP
jgi:hypothetical protein